MSFQSISQVLPDPFTLSSDYTMAPLTGVTHMATVATFIADNSGQVYVAQPAVKINMPSGLFGAPIVIPIDFNNNIIFGTNLLSSNLLSSSSLVKSVIDILSIITNKQLPVTPAATAPDFSTTNNYYQLPTLRDLMGIWGGTTANNAVVIPGGSFMPLRQNNSWNQVQVGNVFSVPVFNFSVAPLVFVPGQGSTISVTTPAFPFDLTNNTLSLTTSSNTTNAVLMIAPLQLLLDILAIFLPGAGITLPIKFKIYQQLIFTVIELPSTSNPTGSYTLAISN